MDGQSQALTARQVSTLESEPVRRMIRTIILEAMSKGAHEILLEPSGLGLLVSYIVRTTRHRMTPLPRSLMIPIMQTIKEAAQLGAATDGADDGEMLVRTKGRVYQLLVLVTPSEQGDCISIRLPV